MRTAIKAVSGHADDQVLVAGAAPWNALLTYPGNTNGDWVQYFADVLKAIGAANCDGVTVHTYTHGTDPALIRSEAKMAAPYQNRRFHFRAYQDFMAAIPQEMRGLPVYITETDQGDDPWRNANTGWVRQAYDEINAWNLANDQKIRSLVLYRWPNVPAIAGASRASKGSSRISAGRWACGIGGKSRRIRKKSWEAELAQLEAQVKALQPDVDKVAVIAAAATKLGATSVALGQGVKAVDPAALRERHTAARSRDHGAGKTAS